MATRKQQRHYGYRISRSQRPSEYGYLHLFIEVRDVTDGLTRLTLKWQTHQSQGDEIDARRGYQIGDWLRWYGFGIEDVPSHLSALQDAVKLIGKIMARAEKLYRADYDADLPATREYGAPTGPGYFIAAMKSLKMPEVKYAGESWTVQNADENWTTWQPTDCSEEHLVTDHIGPTGQPTPRD